MKRVLLTFASIGIIGGAERRLVRSFAKIREQDPSFTFDVWLLMLNKLDVKDVNKQYRALSDIDVRCFYNKRTLMDAIIHSSYNCLCYTDGSYRCLPILISGIISRKKRLMICANTVGSSQKLSPHIKQILYNIDVRLSNTIDCLYPSNTLLLQSKFPNKEITCTPCSFTDLDVYKPIYPKQKVIVFMGRLIDIKGIQTFVEACILIQKDIRAQGYVCEIYGTGDKEKKIRQMIIDNSCDEIIRVKGHVSNSANVFSQTRIFCSLQVYGNYPSQSLLEAMACGNYCIVTDTADSKLLVKEEFGKLVNQDPQSVADAIQRAMSIPDERYNEIAQKARLFLGENHSIEKSAAYYRNKIDRMLEY